MSNVQRRTALVVSLAGCLAGVAHAQDSVSRNADGGSGLPGDALGAWSLTQQRAAYVVDMVPFQTSWRTTFGIAPIAKSGKTSTTRFTSFNGASTISPTLRTGVAYPSASYTRWSAAGGGVETSQNNTALNSSVTPTGTASVFGVAFLDYSDAVSGTIPVLNNQAIGAQVAFDPAQPTRLYVTRVVAAHNTSNTGFTDTAQFGIGGVDAAGNVHFRADGSISTAPSGVINGENYFRVSLPARTNTLNIISSTGASQPAATAWVVNNSSLTLNTPIAIPSDLSTRPVTLGTNFNKQFLAETSPGVVTGVSTHLGTINDHRGPASFSSVQAFPETVGTLAMIARGTSNTIRNDRLILWGVDANGNLSGQRTLSGPILSISDACGGGFSLGAAGDFRHYESQVSFRGGNGPIAIGKDQAGRTIVAGVVVSSLGVGGTANGYNAIVAQRFDANTTSSWNPIAWVNTPGTDGKSILGDYGADGAPGTNDAGENDGVINATDAPIGRLASMSELSLGKTGPSLSAPMIDSVGNIWFTASIQVKRAVGQVIANEFTIGLIRAVYDPATFCYSLELVAKVGDTFLGANSATRYQLAYLGVADSDSVASEAPWAGNMTQQSWNKESVAAASTRDSLTLGGLVISARIVYDMNNDSLYQDPTAPGGIANSPDEAYNVVLYVGNTTPPVVCVADFDDGTGTGTPDGGVGIEDLLYYLGLFEAGTSSADVDDGTGTGVRDGGVGIEDLLYFLQRFEQGC